MASKKRWTGSGLLAQVDANVIEEGAGLFCLALRFDEIVLGDIDRREDYVDVAGERVLHVAVFRVLLSVAAGVGEVFGERGDIVHFDIEVQGVSQRNSVGEAWQGCRAVVT